MSKRQRVEDKADPFEGLPRDNSTPAFSLILTELSERKNETRSVYVPEGVLNRSEFDLIRVSSPHLYLDFCKVELYRLLFNPNEAGSSMEKIRPLGLFQLAGEPAHTLPESKKVNRALFVVKTSKVYSFVLIHTTH